MKNSKKRIGGTMNKKLFLAIMMIFIIGLMQSSFADYRSVTIDGFCYLEDAADHSGTKVLFFAVSASASTDSTYTNADGSFLMGLTEGIYTVHYSHEGWQPYTIPTELEFFADSTLATVTLSAGLVEEVTGPQSGIWTSDYTYQVIGDISVNNGDSLFIEPGVTVKFMDYYSFTIYGKLIAAGTEADTIRFSSGQPSWNPDDWNRIIFYGSSDSNSVISYAKIEYANDGIFCHDSSPTISNNTILNNGEGISCSNNSSPTISNNTISNNNYYGICCDLDCSPTISNNTISNNNGIFCYDSSPTISNNTISNNDDYGIYCENGSSPTISNNTISNNDDGIKCYNASSPSISNNTISNNNSSGIVCIDSHPTILNNILYDNSTGINAASSPSSLEYNLFWLNNTAGSGDGIPSAFGEIVTVNANGDSCDTYCNLFMDPLFVEPSNLNFNLTENSPCIDAGDPDPIYYDPDGTVADMGAFYYDQGSSAPVINDFTAVPTEGTEPLVVQFSQDITNPVTEYNWVFGDGGTSHLPNPVYVYTIPGTYSVTLSVTGPGGSDSMTKTDYITVLEQQIPPNANFSATPLFGIVPLYVDFTNLSSGEIDSLLWNFGDGETSTEINPSHEYQNSGLYTISLTAYGPYGTDTETKVDYIEAIEPQQVIAAFDVSGNYGCSPYTVIFTNQSVGTIDSLLWNFGDGETSYDENPVHAFVAGEFEVLLTVYGQINTDTATDTIIVGSAEPIIISIEDRPEDQGGYVYIHFMKSFYDTNVYRDGRSTEGYSFERMDEGYWISVNSIYATGASEYTAEVTTSIDSSATSTGITSFRVIAAMDEGTWISEVVQGYSVDNIAPAAPEGLDGIIVGNSVELQWQPCSAADFQYFAIYKSDEGGNYPDEPIGTTIETTFTDEVSQAMYYAVTSFDCHGNESEYSETFISETQHFIPCYTGNGYNNMTFFITLANINGIDMEVGDEIGIFDGELCVGAAELTGVISADRDMLQMVASADDPTTGELDGFIDGNSIIYKLWDASENTEIINVIPTYAMGDGTFLQLDTAMVGLEGTTHFIPVYPGNGYNNMTFFIGSATIDDLNMEQGDEIGIFDGDICVGAGVLISEIPPIFQMVASADDPTTGDIDGFTDGNPIIYRLWDASEITEITYVLPTYTLGDGTFSQLGTAMVDLEGFGYVEQTIGLLAGWNMISFYNEPDNMDIQAIMQTLIDAGELFKVQDEGGLALVELPPPIGWYNGIGDMATTEGYYIKVLANTQLYTIGSLVALPKDIPLIAGWNMMSYPVMTPQDGLAVVQPLIDAGDLFKVQNEAGLAIVELPPPIGWYNGIGDFLAGEGYYIKVNSDATLTINEPVDFAQKRRILTEKNTQQSRESSHFISNWNNNPYMAMNVFVTSLEIEGLSINDEDELGIFDGELCVGSAVIEDELISLIASTDDLTTEEIDGFTVGNEMSFRFWDSIENIEIELTVTEISGDETFTSLGTSVVELHANTTGNNNELIPTVTKLGSNYPNPFNPETTINFSMKESGHVTLEIYNIKGQRVRTLINEFRAAGYHKVVWDGTDDKRNPVSSGIYFYKLKTDNFEKTKKMILMK